jgi:hypothetical protein
MFIVNHLRCDRVIASFLAVLWLARFCFPEPASGSDAFAVCSQDVCIKAWRQLNYQLLHRKLVLSRSIRLCQCARTMLSWSAHLSKNSSQIDLGITYHMFPCEKLKGRRGLGCKNE